MVCSGWVTYTGCVWLTRSRCHISPQLWQQIPGRKTNSFPLHQRRSSNEQTNKKKLGRPTNVKKHNAFLDAVEYLEKYDDETMDELHDVYTKMQLERLLIDHYGDEVSITSIRQQANIETLTPQVKNIIHEAHTKAANVGQSNMDQLIKIVGWVHSYRDNKNWTNITICIQIQNRWNI